MSKTLWHTIKLEVPKEMINITKIDKVVVKKSLTKTNNISKSNKEPSIKIIPGDTNKPKIISDGKEWNVEELKLDSSLPAGSGAGGDLRADRASAQPSTTRGRPLELNPRHTAAPRGVRQGASGAGPAAGA